MLYKCSAVICDMVHAVWNYKAYDWPYETMSCALETNLYIEMCYLADYEKVLSLHHSLGNHGIYAVSNFILIFIDIGPINVAVAGQNGCLHSLCDLTWSRLEQKL